MKFLKDIHLNLSKNKIGDSAVLELYKVTQNKPAL